jgi:probable phosphoglycerate mutase
MPRSDYPELFVLRHGQTEWNAAGRMQGHLDSPLTPLGRDQARAQGRLLAAAGVTAAAFRLFCSPQHRARDTAGIAFAGLAAPVVTDIRLREISLGDWDGLTRAEIGARWPVRTDDHPFLWYDNAPSGEGFAAVAVRVAAFLDDLAAPAVIVTHGMTSRFLRARVLGLDLQGAADLPGGQGVVYHLKDGTQRILGV